MIGVAHHWGDRTMKGYCAVALTIVLALGFSPASHAEYLIYLKGGHYIVADKCTFSARGERRQEVDREKENATIAHVKDCAKLEHEQKPEGQIFWSTIDGKFGEINADEVYYIYGGKELVPIVPHREAKPLEDYLIINRGDSFINAKTVSEREGRVYGVQREDIANVNRRAVTEIIPAADVASRSGEDLCRGQSGFAVSETLMNHDHFLGTFTNLSRDACTEASFAVEVTDRGVFFGKFPVKDATVVRQGTSIRFDASIEDRFRDAMERWSKDKKNSGVHVCYSKVESRAQCEAEVREQRK